MSLQAKMDAFKADFAAGKPPYNVPYSAIELMRRATAELKATGLAERARAVGDKAPEFTLDDPEGNPVSSVDLLKQGPLVISFYRGFWCPFCNIELQALQAALPDIQALGANLIAISPQTAPNSRKSMRQNGLTFPILSDEGGRIGEAFGLKFKLPDYLIEPYRGLGADLPVLNNDPEWTLPMPARFVIGQDGVILYAEVNPDIVQRPEPDDVLPVIQKAVGINA